MQSILNAVGGWPTLIMGGLIILVIAGVMWRHAISAMVAQLITALGWLWTLILWGFPPIIMLIGWLFTELHQVVAFQLPSAEVRSQLWVPVLFGLAWLAAQWATAQDANVSYRILIRDLVVSIAWAYLFIAIAAFEAARGNLQYWELVPALLTSTEALLNARTAINNAFQKSPIQQQKAE